MNKKHHPQNRYERRLLDKRKKLKLKQAKEHDDGIRRKVNATTQGDDSLEEIS